MNKEEFSEYMDKNSNVRNIFAERALSYQQEKNQARQPAKRWRDGRVEREAEKMYDNVLNNIYEQIKRTVQNSTERNNWIQFIDENDLFDDLEQSMNEMSFE
ncbi:hypothetical protein [Pediococcus claussenii]|uniref:Uncharacterized protein n=1 Tax=Pediococcus claussenii (strain ATCC BAA-344 / DSM 14800 / JCM 18046 / KCTC 3811 / LMG 21948 / P06) TaxID=701521 RepID=G8PDA4_PEDCP|nr:hypothetical protein [Pediococcus claussenii]AEV95239.1 hypothetical protein PECL_970 [Pediococcus claussenii ATCC BAA-344]ANZ70468.1 hypothetical protein AYR57_09115 [Pediococcus claussenii]ANZ72283.1 hypothetical protein AYR58_09115 [Pediococcus claussenii]KRN19579.1 hypothetical protein IV79_GL001296 [Pediococcus claussenii]